MEASARTRTYDLVRDVRKRRYVWLGHILRMKGLRLLKVAAKVQFDLKSEGNLFMDTPQHLTFNQIQHRAQYRQRWKQSWDSPTAYADFQDIPPAASTQRRPAYTHASDAASAVVQALNQSPTGQPATPTAQAPRRNPRRKTRASNVSSHDSEAAQ